MCKLHFLSTTFYPLVILLAVGNMSFSESQVSTFVTKYCLGCHRGNEPKGDLSLEVLVDNPANQNDVLKLVFEKIKSGEMPPAKAKRPRTTETRLILVQIRRDLAKVGIKVNDVDWLDPSRGNAVDHDELFSPNNAATTATRGRLWRLTGQAYEEFVQSLNRQYSLGFKTYGHTRVRAPWDLSSNEGFRDYAAKHRIGEPEIEHHLRNATRVARAIIAKIPKTRAEELQPFKEFFKSSSPTDMQIRAATAAAFAGVLGRPATTDESVRYVDFLKSNLKLGNEKAAEQLLVAVLFHPELMYRIELPVEGSQRTMLPPRDLARAISYALTDQAPDGELRLAIDDGRMADRDEIRKQIERILANKEIDKSRILRFFQEYFGYTKAIDVFKDDETRKAAGLRGKNDWHPNFFVNDTDLLIQWILAKDQNVLYELLTTPKTFVVTGNTKQADGIKRNPDKPFSLFAQTTLDIYEVGIERKQWSDERPFDMPVEHRMGILTHPSWLIAHSTNFDNHAIHRGRWIRERLLGGRIPDLPVTVDAQLPDEPDKTLRERMRVTRDEYCWKCHQFMDPLGLPLEQFDHFGRFRTTELKETVATTGSIQESGDAKIDGDVKNPFDLLRKLAGSKRVEQVFVRHAFRYFLGRNETLADGPTLVAAHKSYKENRGSMNALIVSLLTSDAFLYRTIDTDPTKE